MPRPKLTKLELQILEVLWTNGQGIHPRNSGIISRASPRLHHHSNHSVSAGRKESRAPRPQNQQRAYF